MLKRGELDLGLTGGEWLMEHDVPRGQWCFGMSSYTATVCLLMERHDIREPRLVRSVVTPYPNLARSLLADVVPGARIVAVAGSSEGLVPDLGDACLDLVETGSTAALNGLAVRRRFGVVTTHLARSENCQVEQVKPVVKLLAAARPAAS